MEVAVVDADPFPLRSSLEGMGRVASMISMFWETSFSLKGSLGHLEVGGILGHFLGKVCCLLSVLRLLCHLGGDVGCGKSFGWTFLAFICLFGDQVSLRA